MIIKCLERQQLPDCIRTAPIVQIIADLSVAFQPQLAGRRGLSTIPEAVREDDLTDRALNTLEASAAKQEECLVRESKKCLLRQPMR